MSLVYISMSLILEINIVITAPTSVSYIRILQLYYIIIIIIFIINKVCRQRFLGPSGFEIRINFFGDISLKYVHVCISVMTLFE